MLIQNIETMMRALPSIVLYLLPAIVAAALALYAWQRPTREAKPFSLLMAAVAFWSFCHTLSVASPTPDWALWWAQIQYAGIVAVGPCWLLFALVYAKRWKYITTLTLAILIVPPLLAYGAVLTNGWHQLWWSHITPDTTRPFVAIRVQRGPLFWLHTVYSYTCILLGLSLFIATTSERRVLYRHQAQLVVLAALFPLVGNIVHLLGVQVQAVDDPTPFLFAASGALMYYATRQFQLLHLSPSAQQEILDEIPDGLVMLDKRGIIAAINPAAAIMLATSTSECLGQPLRHLAETSPLAASLAALWATPPATPLTLSNQHNAKEQVIEVRLRPIAGGRGPDGSLLLLRDITERSHMERQLEQRLTELSLVSRIGSVANAATHTDILLQSITSEIVQTMHWDRVIIGLLEPQQTALRIVADESPGYAGAAVTGRMLSEDEFGIIFDSIRSGAPRILSVSDATLQNTPTSASIQALGLHTVLLVPLTHRSTPLGVLGVGYRAEQPIKRTELHLYEAVGQLISDAITRARLYEAANEASALKMVFLATVSHELRTPLTSIIGYTDMIDQGVFGPLPERVIEPLDHVRHSGQILLHLINDILDYSKMEAGHFNVDLYPVDVTTVIQSVASALQPQLHERNLALELHLVPELPLAYANSGRLAQIITNLLANAVKFTEQGFIRVSTASQESLIEIRVQDTGIGIAPEQLAHIFQPFHQVDNQMTRRFGGTGLGLAITQRLVELMHGTISVESAPGQGSTFICTFQVATTDIFQAREVPNTTSV